VRGRRPTSFSPDVVSSAHARVDAHKTAALCGRGAGRGKIGREGEMLEMANVGEEVGSGVLGIETRLEGVPHARHLCLSQRQSAAGGYEELPLDEID